MLSVSSLSAAAASAGAQPSWLRTAEQSARARPMAPAREHGATATATATVAAPVVPPNTVVDPPGDVPFGQGDIIDAGFVENTTSFVFGIKVKKPVNPKTDPAWLAGLPFAAIALDTNRDQIPDDIIFVFPDLHGGMQSTLASVSNDHICDGQPAYVAGYGYTTTFAKNCLPIGLKFQFQVAMSYTTDPSAAFDFDLAPDRGFSPTVVAAAAVHSSGYWMLGADGRVYGFGGAVGFPGVVPGAAAMAPRADGKGYWVTDTGGHVRAYGSARSFGGSPSLGANERITTIAATPTANGYWLFSNQGRVFAYGDAHGYGDMSGTRLNGQIIASTATPSGKGYYMIGQDGGIFAFGDARFYGSTGSMHLNKPIVGMSPTPSGRGYWLVGSDGGVFAFDAPFRGSMGGTKLNREVNGLVSYGNGYLMAAADGGVFDFSDRPFVGSLAEHPPSAPIIGLAAFGT